MNRTTEIGLAVGLGIFGVLVAVTIGMMVAHHLRTYRTTLLRIGDSYILDGVPHVLSPLSHSGRGLVPLLRDDVARELKAMYTDLRRVCDALGIRCWASGGTLLGWVRHRGFIPWDDDIDLHMHRDDLATLRGERGQALLRQAGLALAWMPAYRREILKIMRPQRRAGKLQLRHYPALDVLAVDTVNGELGTCGSSLQTQRCGRLLKKERWQEDDIFPLREETFEDIRMWLPRRPEALVRIQYGEAVFRSYRVDLLHWSSFWVTFVPLPPAPEGEEEDD